MSSSAATVLDFGVDYITVTATHPPRTKSLIDVAKENLEAEASAGNEVTKWQGLGYHGKACGGASYGVGPQGVIARLTSGTARDNWKALFLWGSKCTRIDLQITVRDGRTPHEVLVPHWTKVREKWEKCPGLAEPKLTCGPMGYQTIRIGSRQSERFARIYDKFAESKLDDYRDAVRYEVEFKGKRSNMVARHLAPMPRTIAPVASHLSGFFSKYTIALPVAADTSAHFSVPAKEPDCFSKMRYIESCIGPLVNTLVCRFGAEAVVEALKLTPFVDVRSDAPNGVVQFSKEVH